MPVRKGVSFLLYETEIGDEPFPADAGMPQIQLALTHTDTELGRALMRNNAISEEDENIVIVNSHGVQADLAIKLLEGAIKIIKDREEGTDTQ